MYSWLCYCLAEWPYASHLTSFSLCFLICKMWIGKLTPFCKPLESHGWKLLYASKWQHVFDQRIPHDHYALVSILDSVQGPPWRYSVLKESSGLLAHLRDRLFISKTKRLGARSPTGTDQHPPIQQCQFAPAEELAQDIQFLYYMAYHNLWEGPGWLDHGLQVPTGGKISDSRGRFRVGSWS